MRHDAPPRPETWMVVMLGLIGLCAGGALLLFFLDALSLPLLAAALALLSLAAVSVCFRHRHDPGRMR